MLTHKEKFIPTSSNGFTEASGILPIAVPVVPSCPVVARRAKSEASATADPDGQKEIVSPCPLPAGSKL
jgi:hypothetical protein